MNWASQQAKLIYYSNRLGLAPRRRSVHFYEAQTDAFPEFAIPDVRFGALSADELSRLEYCGGWLSLRESLAKLKNPGWLIGAVRGGGLLGYAWGETEVADFEFFDLNISLQSDTAYMSRVFVSNAARGLGLGKALQCEFARHGLRQGYRRIFFCADVKNAAMSRIQESLRVRRYVTADYLRLLNFRRYQFHACSSADVLVTRRPEVAANAALTLGSALHR